jgi:hypothetical protein
MDPSKIQGIITAPVTSQDATSPEAILAREAKKIQAQAEVDTKYDPLVERYRNFEQPTVSVPLVCAAVALGLLGLAVLIRGQKR